MKHGQFDKFYTDITDAIEDIEEATWRRFSERLGEFLYKEIKKQAHSGHLMRYQETFLRNAFAIAGGSRVKKLEKHFQNVKEGQASKPDTIAIYFLLLLTEEHNREANELYSALWVDNDETFEGLAKWRPTPEFKFLDVLKERIERDPDAPILTSPEQSSAFHFTDRFIETLGRDAEKKHLRAFLNDGIGLRWMQIAGVGGQGKSRLAYDLVQSCQDLWRANFLVGENVGHFASEGRAARWQPKRATLIVIDYVIGQEESVGAILRALAARTDFDVQVRLLLVERQRWDRGGLEAASQSDDKNAPKFSIASGQADWYDKLVPYSGDNARDFRERENIQTARFKGVTSGVVELTHLNDTSLLTIIHGIAQREIDEGDGQPIAIADDQILKHLHRIDKQGRPLFAYFLARALAHGKFQDDWGLEDLLEDTLKRDRNSRWTRAFPDADLASLPELDDDSAALHLAVLATMLGGLDARTDNGLAFAGTAPSKSDIREAQILTDTPLGAPGIGTGRIIAPLQPDILGEWFVLRCLELGGVSRLTATQLAWQHVPKDIAAFLKRAVQDFPQRTEAVGLFDSMNLDKNARDAFARVAGSIFTSLWKKDRSAYPQSVIDGLEHAASLEDPDGLFVYGFCLLTGTGFAKAADRAIPMLERAAKAGNVAAMFNLGVVYNTGDGVEKDRAQALDWYRKAADAGNAAAMFNLGVAYDTGYGVEKDRAQALDWWHKAADAGNAAAMFNLGVAYDTGYGVKKNRAQALDWYRKAAQLGISEARPAANTLTFALNKEPLPLSPDEQLVVPKVFLGMDWADVPPIHGDWKDVRADYAVNVATKLIHSAFHDGYADLFASQRITAIRKTSLPFYSDVDLLDVQLEGEKPADLSLMSALVDSRAAVLLDGTSPRLRAINEARLLLKDEAACKAYLRFFCEFVCGDEGPFHIVESERGLEVSEEHVIGELRDAGIHIMPIEQLSDTTNGGQHFKAWVVYGDTLYIATFAIQPSGHIEMLEAEPLRNSLPIKRRDYNGVLRSIPKAR